MPKQKIVGCHSTTTKNNLSAILISFNHLHVKKWINLKRVMYSHRLNMTLFSKAEKRVNSPLTHRIKKAP